MLSSRRQFLAASAAGATSLMLPRAAQSEEKFPGMIVRMTEPLNLEFPFPSLTDKVIPNERFYVRNHFPIPKIAGPEFKLTVEGAVERPLSLTLEDILKMSAQTREATLECGGNGRVFLAPTVSGLQWGHGGVGNASWTGVPLAAILDKAGVKKTAVEVLLVGADKGVLSGDAKSPGAIPFDRSLPLAKAVSPEVLLAHRMNGEELPARHGFPLRAVVPGYYGMASIKWLTKIIVLDKPYNGFFQSLEYSRWTRETGTPSLVAANEMQVKSAIAQPSLDSRVKAGSTVRVFGAAWTGDATVAKVEISTDGGASYNPAKVVDAPEKFVWSRFEYEWKVPAGLKGVVKVISRATDSKGNVQPKERDIDRRSYMINHLVPVDVAVE